MYVHNDTNSARLSLSSSSPAFFYLVLFYFPLFSSEKENDSFIEGLRILAF